MKLRSLIQLMRLDKPIGIWLLYYPAGWAVALTAAPQQMWSLQIKMLLGAALTRAAGCIINDLTDRKLDQHVERTRNRPLASGAVQRWEAVVVLAILLCAALCIALALPPRVFWLALLAVPMIAAYPWMKRITWWPQLFLGLTFNLSALFGWLATSTPLSTAAFTLYAAAIFWTLGYDTVYAVQDIADDARVGIRSSARRVGKHLRPFITACYGAMLLLLLLTAALASQGPWVYCGLAVAGWHAWRQVQQLPPSPAQAGEIFRSNRWLGFLVLTGFLLARAA